MSNLEMLSILVNVRSDYIAMARDCHGLKKLIRPFDVSRLPLVDHLNRVIQDLKTNEPRSIND